MKKFIALLTVALSFVLSSLPAAGMPVLSKAHDALHVATAAYEAAALTLPNTDLHPAHNEVQSGGSHQQKLSSGPGCIDALGFLHRGAAQASAVVSVTESFRAKAYLAHIYPSHNFW